MDDIVYKSKNSVAIICDKANCDYYSFLNKDVSAVNSYRGEYMLQYSWAEMTNGLLSFNE